MSWEIKYKDKYTGKETVHVNNNNESDARGWMESLQRQHGGKVTVTHVANGPYDHSGKRTEIASEGNE